MKNNILVYGCFGYINNQLDGQTIKTRAIYDLLKEKNNGKVNYIDSLELRKKKTLVINFIKKLFHCKYIFFIGAGHNLKYIFPFVFLLSKILRFEIIYIAVGGWLNKHLSKWCLHRWMMKNISGILVQNESLIKDLEIDCNIYGAKKIVNFRTKTEKFIRKNDGYLRLVYMARIQKKKGLDSLAKLAQFIQKKYPNKITLDFYGQIKDQDRNYFFNELVNKYDFVNYNGFLKPEEIVSTLNAYDVLVLPTHYFTEGFPGSILDAYRACLPVIVTEWKYAHEFVKDGVSGYIIPFDNCENDLCKTIDNLIKNPENIPVLKSNSYNESLKYTPENAWQTISQYLK